MEFKLFGYPNLGNTCFINSAFQALKLLNYYQQFINERGNLNQLLSNIFSNKENLQCQIKKIVQLLNFTEKIKIGSFTGGDSYNVLLKTFDVLFSEFQNGKPPKQIFEIKNEYKDIYRFYRSRESELKSLFSSVISKGAFCDSCNKFCDSDPEFYVEQYQFIINVSLNDNQNLQDYFNKNQNLKLTKKRNCNGCSNDCQNYAKILKCPKFLIINFDKSLKDDSVNNSLFILEEFTKQRKYYKLVGIIHHYGFHYIFTGKKIQNNVQEINYYCSDSVITYNNELNKQDPKIVFYVQQDKKDQFIQEKNDNEISLNQSYNKNVECEQQINSIIPKNDINNLISIKNDTLLSDANNNKNINDEDLIIIPDESNIQETNKQEYFKKSKIQNNEENSKMQDEQNNMKQSKDFIKSQQDSKLDMIIKNITSNKVINLGINDEKTHLNDQIYSQNIRILSVILKSLKQIYETQNFLKNKKGNLIDLLRQYFIIDNEKQNVLLNQISQLIQIKNHYNNLNQASNYIQQILKILIEEETKDEQLQSNQIKNENPHLDLNQNSISKLFLTSFKQLKQCIFCSKVDKESPEYPQKNELLVKLQKETYQYIDEYFFQPLQQEKCISRCVQKEKLQVLKSPQILLIQLNEEFLSKYDKQNIKLFNQTHKIIEEYECISIVQIENNLLKNEEIQENKSTELNDCFLFYFKSNISVEKCEREQNESSVDQITKDEQPQVMQTNKTGIQQNKEQLQIYDMVKCQSGNQLTQKQLQYTQDIHKFLLSLSTIKSKNKLLFDIQQVDKFMEKLSFVKKGQFNTFEKMIQQKFKDIDVNKTFFYKVINDKKSLPNKENESMKNYFQKQKKLQTIQKDLFRTQETGQSIISSLSQYLFFFKNKTEKEYLKSQQQRKSEQIKKKNNSSHDSVNQIISKVNKFVFQGIVLNFKQNYLFYKYSKSEENNCRYIPDLSQLQQNDIYYTQFYQIKKLKTE